MKRLYAAVVVLLASAIPAEAQYGGGEWVNIDANVAMRHGVGRYGQVGPYRGDIYGGYYGGGYYDPAYLQQMLSLPGGLVACTVDFSTVRVVGCHPVIKSIWAVEAHARDHSDRGELLGTIHIHKGRTHFRPFDDTDHHIHTVDGGVLGALGGGAVGGAFGGRKGAAIGGIVGALAGGLTASRHSHENCLVIEPTAQSGSSSAADSDPVEEGTDENPISESEVRQIFPNSSVSVPALGGAPRFSSESAEVPRDRKIVRNQFEDSVVRVYDGSERILELGSGEEAYVEVTRSSRIWGEAYLVNNRTGMGEWVPLRSGQGMYSLPQEAGWVFRNRKNRPNFW